MHKGSRVIPIFIPHEGCPHDCVFCNQKKISGSIQSPSVEEVERTIENALNTIDRDKYNIVLAFYGGSFTAISESKQKKYLEIAKHYKEKGYISSIRCSTRPDYLDEGHVKLLKNYYVDHVELGVQSTDLEVLRLSKRYYGLDKIKDAVNNLKKHSINYGFQLMIGLPGDNRSKLIKTCKDLLPLMPKTLRIYPTVVIAGTELEEAYKEKKYTSLTIEKAVDLSLIPYILFKKINTKIIRIGLHASESLLYNGNIIDGPFHSAFGEIVQSRVYWYGISDIIKKENLYGKDLIFYANSKNYSKISGNKGANRYKLKEDYKVQFKFIESETLDEDMVIRYLNKIFYLKLDSINLSLEEEFLKEG